ncbi:hypothetical protein ACQFN5_30090 (plasmid) [Klebsiella sp. WOUb02]|uniref:hypothetical protein n=1 Tax=Klebsiella sp. WOUb02 TaxID=3161071 RepID=UPI003CF491F2
MRLAQTSAALLFTLLLAGCQFHKAKFPPPYIGTPQEISTYEVKGLTFVTTVSFSGLFAENLVHEYAEKHHYRYYVVTMRNNGFRNRAGRMSAMMYR